MINIETYSYVDRVIVWFVKIVFFILKRQIELEMILAQRSDKRVEII